MQFNVLALLFMASVAIAAPSPDTQLGDNIISECAGDKCRVRGEDYPCTGGACADGGHCGGPDVNHLTCQTS